MKKENLITECTTSFNLEDYHNAMKRLIKDTELFLDKLKYLNIKEEEMWFSTLEKRFEHTQKMFKAYELDTMFDYRYGKVYKLFISYKANKEKSEYSNKVQKIIDERKQNENK